MTGKGAARQVGFFGGTFDPVHCGHTCIARAAVAELGLDLLHVVPCGLPAHRPAAQSGGPHRLAMLRLAFAAEARIQVDDRELRRAGPSYTLTSVRELCTEHGVDRAWLVLGEDAVRLLHSWEQPAALLAQVDLAVAARAAGAPATAPGRDDWEALAREHGACVRWLEVRPPDVSATAVRAQLAEGDAPDDLLPPPVLEYIHARGLYGVERMQAGNS